MVSGSGREVGWVVGVAVDTACAVSSSLSVGGIGCQRWLFIIDKLGKVGPVLVLFVVTTQ